MFYEGIKSIELIYENCEVVSIPRKYILDLAFLDFKKSFQRIAMNSISPVETYSHVLLEIDGEYKNELSKQDFFGDESSLMGFLLRRRDITNIEVKYEDNYKRNDFSFGVIWHEDDEYSYSRYQENITNELSDVAIIITDGKDPEFNEYIKSFKEEFSDTEGQKTKKELYSIS